MKLFIAVIVAAGVLAGASARAGDAEKELRLAQAIDEALKNNPEIHVLQNKLQSARARGNQSTYLEDPELNLEAWGMPLNQPVNLHKANPIILGLRQKVPFFGKRALKSEIAESEVRMAEEDLRAKQIEVVAKVKNAYAEFFMAEKIIEIAQGHLELIRQVSLTAESLYKVGRVPQQDVIKALLEQTDLLNKLNMAEREVATTKARLNTLLGRPPGTQIGSPADLSLARLSLTADDLERLALEQKPEL